MMPTAVHLPDPDPCDICGADTFERWLEVSLKFQMGFWKSSHLGFLQKIYWTYLLLYRELYPPWLYEAMRAVKQVLDPRGILAPGNLFNE